MYERRYTGAYTGPIYRRYRRLLHCRRQTLVLGIAGTALHASLVWLVVSGDRRDWICDDDDDDFSTFFGRCDEKRWTAVVHHGPLTATTATTTTINRLRQQGASNNNDNDRSCTIDMGNQSQRCSSFTLRREKLARSTVLQGMMRSPFASGI